MNDSSMVANQGLKTRLIARFRPLLRHFALSNPFRFMPRVAQAVLVFICPVFGGAWFGDRTASSGRYRLAWRYTKDEMEGGMANPLFDADWYKSRYGYHGTSAEALLHYWLLGDRLGLRPSAWFDAGFFRRSYRRPAWPTTALMLFLRRWRDYPNCHTLFDPAWYLESYPDVRSAGQNPLVHFVLYGLREGRRPNAYFSPDWYLAKNQDVASSGIYPAVHYFLYGAAEGRSPGPDFDAASYLSRHPEVARTGMDALSHFLTEGRYLGIDAGARALRVSDLEPRPPARTPRPGSHTVDVIIPVYRGLAETRACIESVLKSTSYQSIRLHLYNDASPEPEVTEYLRQIKSLHPEVILVENAENKGFVRTVNSAMRGASQISNFEAVVLLNSDAEVANDWVERLLSHALVGEGNVATVTALSNNATICSYPQIGENDLPPGYDTVELDRLVAKTNAGGMVQVPTGVGFCMLITKEALRGIGFFDEEAFGRGYGEEVDFCMRAAAAGLKNVLALDVFVRHIGEVSFAEVSKPGKAIAQKILRERYPFFDTQVGAFVSADPGLPARVRITVARWRESGRPVHVIVTHGLGGGTERRVQEVIASLASDGHVVTIRPEKLSETKISVENRDSFDGFRIILDLSTGDEMCQLLSLLGTSKVHVHHILGYGEFIREGIALYGNGFDFVVHDYYAVCPQVTLTDEFSRYCGEPDPRGCDTCIASRPSHGASDIRNWRANNEWLVLGAGQVVAPSKDTAERIARYTGRRPDVRYHERAPSSYPTRPHPTRREFRVVVIGVLAPHKGRDTVISAASAARALELPLRLHLIGDPQGEVPRQAQKRLSYTGRYREEDLGDLIEAADADAFLFAAPWPETYSYTLSAAMKTGRPIIAANIGAFTERLENYHSALLVPWNTSGEKLAVLMVDYLRSLQKNAASERDDVKRLPAGPEE